jgi:colicin import membrane protein
MEAEVELRLLPSGQVLDVRVVRGSGDKAFDDSTLAAVKQVGSFSLPEDSDLYEKSFKRIILIFRPEDLMQ